MNSPEEKLARVKYLATKGGEKGDFGNNMRASFSVMDDYATLQMYDGSGYLSVFTKYECIVANATPQVVKDRCRHYNQIVPDDFSLIVMVIKHYLSDMATFYRAICKKFELETLEYAAWYIAEGYNRRLTANPYQKRVSLDACKMLDRGVLYEATKKYELFEFEQ